MIFTQEQADDLVRDLKDVFPNSEPKALTNKNQEITGVRMILKEIDTRELSELKNLVDDLDCYINLKRSGTAISILFN